VSLLHPDGDKGYQFGPLPIGASLLVDVEIDVDAGVIRTAINGEVAGETSTTAGRDYSVDDDLYLGFGSFAGHQRLKGGMQFAAIVKGVPIGEDTKLLAELSGVKESPAYSQSGYVSEYPTSPRRYFAEYVEDYLEARFKPAVEVWPKRRYGAATAQGVKGAHDGAFLGDTAGDGAPVADDYGQSIVGQGDNSGVQVSHHADLDMPDTGQWTALIFGEIDVISGYALRKAGGGKEQRLFCSDDSFRLRLNDGTNAAIVSTQTLTEGTPYLLSASLDRSTDTAAVRAGLASTEATDDFSVIGSVANNGDLNWLSTGTTANLKGNFGMLAILPSILTPAEHDHLHEAAFDRTKRLSAAELEAL